ncbi:MAG: small subunit ribosomal protein, partial [Candidatus Cloacimonadota bacterium]|nr:small subunit ribosomal protein [Candidatus Cloacimonadota bacterium]
MLDHDQNPVDPEIKIEGDDTASKSTEVETVLEKKEEPKLEESTSEIDMNGNNEDNVAEIQEDSEQSERMEEKPAEQDAKPEEETASEEPQAELLNEESKVESAETADEEPAPESVDKAKDIAESEEPEAETKDVAESEEPEAELSAEELEHKDMLSMYEESFSNFKVGEIIEGTIVDVSDKEVRVDIGFKSEGVIPISEFAYSGAPEKNSTIRVFINKIESGDGRLQLSKKKADYQENIQRIKKAFEEGSTIPGVIRRRVKGGMIAEVFGIEGFLPGSQMSIKPIPNLDQFIGKDMQFKVVNLDEEHSNIILSRRAVMEEEAAAKREELLSRIEIGCELEGEVKNITQYGAFIDLGGIDGLLHLTDMSWGKLNHPSEMLAIGDKVKVKVINFDPETNKISLGLKQLVPHPWENIEIKYPEGTHITGKVMSVKSFGAFVELEPGVEGLVHISEMSWTKKITDARKILKNGDTINAIVLQLDKENKRISLGMKQMDPNPWLTIEERYPIGTVLKRKVKSLTAFGVFVEIEEGIDGLVHISDISWTKRIYHPREMFRKGQEIECIILSIDKAQHRIALGVKQLTPDPWETLNQDLPVNSEVIGTISKLIPKGVLVDIPLNEDVVEGFIPISHLSMAKLEHSEDAFHVGEQIPLKVIELDMENRRLILSVKAFFFSRDPKLQEEYIAIHEQYMRDRIARMQKKKAEKLQKDRQAAEAAAKAEKEAAEAAAIAEEEAAKVAEAAAIAEEEAKKAAEEQSPEAKEAEANQDEELPADTEKIEAAEPAPAQETTQPEADAEVKTPGEEETHVEVETSEEEETHAEVETSEEEETHAGVETPEEEEKPAEAKTPGEEETHAEIETSEEDETHVEVETSEEEETHAEVETSEEEETHAEVETSEEEET